MRILLLTVDFAPHTDGVSSLSYHYARRLGELGHDVCVVCPRAPGAAAVDAGAPFRALRFPGYDLGLLRFFPFALAALRAMARHRPDVTFAMNIGYGGPIVWLAALLAPRPYVTMAYGYEFLKFRRRGAMRRLYLAIYRRALFTIAVSRYTRDRLAEFGVSSASVAIVYPGVRVPPGGPPVPPEPRPATPPPRIGTCGRLIRRKGHDLVLRALPAILARVPAARYVVAGDGPLRAELAALSRELGVAASVDFLGRVPDAELPAFYRSLDVFAMPSREDDRSGHVEGFGIVYLEAAAQGVPSIGSRTGGIPEAIVDGETGLLVSPESPAKLAEAVLRLLDDPALRERMGRAAQARAERGFGWDLQVDQVNAALCARLGAGSPASGSDSARPRTVPPQDPPDAPRSGPRLRVAILTRAGRPSGAAMAAAVARSGHSLAGILAESRRTMILRRLRKLSPRDAWDMFGLDFLLARWRGGAHRTGPDAQRTARDAGAPYREVDSLNAPESLAILRSWDADALVVANAPILRAEVFGACRRAALNFHSGRLPDYGGVASEFWALHAGEPSAWATLHRVTGALDTGSILAEREVPIARDDTPESLHAKCIAAGAEALPGVLDRLAAGLEAPLREPGPARLRAWPTAAQRRELRRLRAAHITRR